MSSFLEEIIERNMRPVVPQLRYRDLSPIPTGSSGMRTSRSTRMRQQTFLNEIQKAAEKAENGAKSSVWTIEDKAWIPATLKDLKERVPGGQRAKTSLTDPRSARPDGPDENVRAGRATTILKHPSKYTPQPVPALMNDDDIFHATSGEGDILLHASV